MTRKWIYFVMAGAITLGVHTAGAQEPPPPPPGAEMGPGGPIGPRMELLGFGEMHPGKVVTNAPYSATATIETMQKLNDGNTIDRTTQSSVYRDSEGRTRRDTTFTGAGPLAASGQPRSVSMIHDSLHDRVDDATARQAHSDAIADFELSIVRLLWGWHAEECTPEISSFQGRQCCTVVDTRSPSEHHNLRNSPHRSAVPASAEVHTP